MNVCVEYLYRDGGNFKNWGEVIFSNHAGIEISSLKEEIKKALISEEFFVAEELGIPTLYFGEFDEELDHGWHEFGSISPCNENPIGRVDRDIQDVLHLLKDNLKL